MKSTLSLILSFTIALAASTSRAQVTATGPASSGNSYMDSETLARAFLDYTADHYLVYFNGQNFVSNQWQYVNMQLTLDLNQYATNLNINGNTIPLPQPLNGIPIPAGGYQDVNVSVQEVDKYGNIAATGNFSTNFLGQGSPIPVTMIPTLPPTAIQLPPGLNPSEINVSLTGANGGWGYSYDPVTGLLTISVFGDISTDVGYTVTDEDGGLIARGTLPFFQAKPGAGSNTNSVLTLDNAGGVVNMPLGTEGFNYGQNLPLDGSVERNGSAVNAKVITVPDVNNSDLYVYLLGSNVKVEVRQWSPSGDLQLVPSTITTDAYGDTTLITSQPVQKAIITILQTGTGTPSIGFIEVSGYGNGGGSKG